MGLDEIIAVTKAIIIVQIFYVATITMVKISLGIFLLRIIIKKWQKRVIYAVLAFSTTWGIVTLFVAIFQCGYPKSAIYYLESRMFGKCISGPATNGITYTHGVISALSDFTFTALPLFILQDAKMNRRARILLSVILSLGGM